MIFIPILDSYKFLYAKFREKDKGSKLLSHICASIFIASEVALLYLLILMIGYNFNKPLVLSLLNFITSNRYLIGICIWLFFFIFFSSSFRDKFEKSPNYNDYHSSKRIKIFFIIYFYGVLLLTFILVVINTI
jgi:hypothetical protein